MVGHLGQQSWDSDSDMEPSLLHFLGEMITQNDAFSNCPKHLTRVSFNRAVLFSSSISEMKPHTSSIAIGYWLLLVIPDAQQRCSKWKITISLENNEAKAGP
jgi:hypothetical protein